jgi:hypothetical protein
VKQPAGKHFDTKPNSRASRHRENPPTGNLERYDNRRNDTTNHQSGTSDRRRNGRQPRLIASLAAQ